MLSDGYKFLVSGLKKCLKYLECLECLKLNCPAALLYVTCCNVSIVVYR